MFSASTGRPRTTKRNVKLTEHDRVREEDGEADRERGHRRDVVRGRARGRVDDEDEERGEKNLRAERGAGREVGRDHVGAEVGVDAAGDDPVEEARGGRRAQELRADVGDRLDDAAVARDQERDRDRRVEVAVNLFWVVISEWLVGWLVVFCFDWPTKDAAELTRPRRGLKSRPCRRCRCQRRARCSRPTRSSS